MSITFPSSVSHTGRNVPDSAGWADAMAWWDACIEAHAAVGAKYIVQPSMGRDAYASLEKPEKNIVIISMQ
jgi:hypothetical protein